MLNNKIMYHGHMEPSGTISVPKEKRSRSTQLAVCKIYAWYQPDLHLAFSGGDDNPCLQIIKKI